MRLLPLVSVIALLSLGSTFSLTPSARAEELKYKSRPAVQPPATRQPQPPVYKPPPDNRPPAQRPPDKEHPYKKPPEPRQPPDPPTPPPPPPIPHGRWSPDPPCPPRPCPLPDPGDQEWIDPPCPIEEPVLQPIAMDLNSVLSRSMRMMQIEGFAGQVVVGYDGQVQFERSYRATGYSDIAQVTKAFTAWAVYLLVESGNLSFATTLGELFPSAPADKRDITVVQLLAQTSGLRNTYSAGGERDRDSAVGKLLAQPLAHKPGAEFTYSDDGYVILAAAIEVASGMSYESFLMESGVLSPDMTSTVFPGERGTAREEADWRLRGAGGILSTAHDLFTWTSRFLNSPQMEDIVEPRENIDDVMEAGYGWYWTRSREAKLYRTGRDSDEPLLRTSGVVGFGDNAMVVVYPNGTILAVTSDRSYGKMPWSERVANALEPVLRHSGPGVEPLPVTLPVIRYKPSASSVSQASSR